MKTCNTCSDLIEKEVRVLNRLIRVNISCSCKRLELEKKERKREYEEKRDRMNTILRNYHMEGSYKDKTFENWDFNKGDIKNYNLGINYVKNFEKIKEKALGLLIYGTVGNGKSYLSFSIANGLQGTYNTVCCISITGLLERFKETYKSFGSEGENEILKALNKIDLLIIDDLGVEKNTEWSVSKIYEIVDGRYRSGLPLIITTNLGLDELRERYEDRVSDRLCEMCTNIHFKSRSIRHTKGKENVTILREMLCNL